MNSAKSFAEFIKGKKVRPTGTCFDDSLELFMKLLKEDPIRIKNGAVKLVHGICTNPDGELFAHGWVEHGQNAIICFFIDDEKSFVSIPRKGFYEKFGVKDCTKYKPKAAWEENERVGTYGPWEEKYMRFCLKNGVWQGDATNKSGGMAKAAKAEVET